MVDLTSVLPADVLESARKTVDLQEALMSITDESFSSVVELVMGLPFIHRADGVRTLTNNLLLGVKYRPFHLSIMAKLFGALVERAGPDNCLIELKHFLLLIPVKVIDERWRLAMIHECWCIGVLSDQEVFDAILAFFKLFPLLPNKPFWRNNSRQHFAIFIWFAPLLEKMDRAMFDEIWGRMKMYHSKKELSSNYNDYIATFESMRENDWKEYRYLTRYTYPLGSLASILRNDQLDKLKELAEQPNFDVNQRIESNLFESTSFLLRRPTLVQFCAIYGSVNCFNYLVEKGADLALMDCMKRILLHFAIAGGHPDIVRVATETVHDFVVATRVSAEFHRFELFKWFLTTKKTDLKANDIENGSIFHGIAAANHIRMILFCIEEGCDINLKDADGVCFLFIGHHLTVLLTSARWNRSLF